MQRTDGLEVSPGRLEALAADWLDQIWDVTSAQHSLSDAALSGFPPLVEADLAVFLDAWSDAFAALSTSLEGVADGLVATAADLVDVDQSLGDGWP